MKKIFLYFSFSLFYFTVNAQLNITREQRTISGKIKDDVTKTPVEYVTITLYKQGATTPLNGTITNNKGIFILNNLPVGEYKIVIDFVGYSRLKFDHIVINETKRSVFFNDVLLKPVQRELNTVNVTAKANIVENKIDKMVYNVANDITSQGGVATDVLKKIPMVTVDIDGNVELLGNPSVLFLINGKPSSIFGASLADALQSIPASQIKSIEVITSPGAKYNATGTGGIINIILKDNKVQGYNGNINLSAGTRLENGSLNLNLRKKTFGINAFFSGNKTLPSHTINTKDRLKISNDTLQHQKQNGDGYLERTSYQTGLAINWDISKKDNFIAGLAYHHFGNRSDGLVNQEDQGIVVGNSPYADLFSLRNFNSAFSENAVDINLEYKKTFNKENQELGITYTSSYNRNNTDYYQKSDYTNNNPSIGSKGNNPGKDNEMEIGIDYAQPLSDKFTLETGVNITARLLTAYQMLMFSHPLATILYLTLNSTTVLISAGMCAPTIFQHLLKHLIISIL